MPDPRLLLFTRYPVPGSTKTRLIPELGPEGAADFQEWLTGHSVLAGGLWASQSGGLMEIHSTGASVEQFHTWLGREKTVYEQVAGDLGERLATATQNAFESGATQVCMIGIDCPALSPDHFSSAFEALTHQDVCLIPATDGGYVLLGMRSFHPELFQQIDWGTDQVLEQTLHRCHDLSLTVWQGPPLQDMDVAEDLDSLPAWRQQETGLSVIIPAYNEEATIQAAIESAQSGSDDVIVVDGGSRDRTLERAQQSGARVITGYRGRGAQLNAGAWHAQSDTLVFLHADSTLPKGYQKEVSLLLEDPEIGLGAFSLSIRGNHPGLRLVEWGANLRSRCRKRPYGDQGFFVKRDLFERLSGFPCVPLLEDLELALAIGKRKRVVTSPLRISCSGRRWDEKGILRTTLRNQQILRAYDRGISPHELAKWYYGKQ